MTKGRVTLKQLQYDKQVLEGNLLCVRNALNEIQENRRKEAEEYLRDIAAAERSIKALQETNTALSNDVSYYKGAHEEQLRINVKLSHDLEAANDAIKQKNKVLEDNARQILNLTFQDDTKPQETQEKKERTPYIRVTSILESPHNIRRYFVEKKRWYGWTAEFSSINEETALAYAKDINNPIGARIHKEYTK